jgi:aryl-alcohol dehydrogenase-like predicted oxidoreductase
MFFFQMFPRGRGVSIYRNLSASSIREECEQSLKRLNTDYIDLYQCHFPDPGTPAEETMGELLKLKEEGKIRAIGISNFAVKMMNEFMKHGEIASSQPEYNLLKRKIEGEELLFCWKNKISVLAYSPIAQGLLSGKVTVDRKFGPLDIRNYSSMFSKPHRQKVLDALEKVRPIAEKHNATLAQLAINWIFSEPSVTSAIVGARNVQQVEENVGALSFSLTDSESQKIREVFEDYDL